MSKIKILDKTITNRISAGEVVEKPASIIKELVENSIDAGATRITISIENGGISKISITDNGHGIEKDDLPLAIMPHATSKISSVEDLNHISTLGFRGEALASICSVSQVEIISKTQNQETGQKIVVHGGDIIHNTEIASPTGTHVEVSNLFYNTPVRAKFLRKPKVEEGDITDYVERLILANPNISFKYIIDGQEKYHTTGSGLFDNIYTIYGKEIANNLIEIDYQSGDYTISGFIGKPEISKPNRNYQTLLIGERYVKNYMISSAISTAYESFLMKGKFPFYVLKLTLPLDCVDVNVHPNKLEVKFEKPNHIYTLFYSAVSKALQQFDQTVELSIFNNADLTNENQTNKKDVEKIVLPEVSSGVSFKDKIADEQEKEDIQEVEIKEVELKTNLFEQKDFSIKFEQFKTLDQVLKSPEKIEIKEEQIGQSEFEKQLDFVKNYKIVGVLFNTYIIIESGEEVYFIDQHAAHERILFDKFMNEIKNQKPLAQELLVPYNLFVKDKERTFLKEHQELLENFGFSIEEFGHNSFKINAIPYVFTSLKVGDFFESLLSNLDEYTKKPEDYLKHSIATKACKSAVKAGDSLTEEEINIILKTMQEGVLHCPHGRPFVVKFDKYSLEKWFKRVV